MILALLLWYWMWGVTGALLAVPMLSTFKIVCDPIELPAAVGHFLGMEAREMQAAPRRASRAEDSQMVAARRAARTAAALLVGTALLATSLAFFTAAVYRALCHSLGDIHALLIVGTAYFMASLIALLIVQFSRR